MVYEPFNALLDFVYYSAIKKNEIATWIYLEIVILSEVRETNII